MLDALLVVALTVVLCLVSLKLSAIQAAIKDLAARLEEDDEEDDDEEDDEPATGPVEIELAKTPSQLWADTADNRCWDELSSKAAPAAQDGTADGRSGG